MKMMSVDDHYILSILEAVLFAAGEPISIERLRLLLTENEIPLSSEFVRQALQQLQVRYQSSGIELVEVASGYRFQTRQAFASWVQRLLMRKPPRYSRALLETLALIAYQQPITRGEIEAIRGVAVSTQIMKTLLDREWIRELGQRDLPGKPTLYGTTKQFLNDFNLQSLTELPPLSVLADIETVATEAPLAGSKE